MNRRILLTIWLIILIAAIAGLIRLSFLPG